MRTQNALALERRICASTHKKYTAYRDILAAECTTPTCVEFRIDTRALRRRQRRRRRGCTGTSTFVEGVMRCRRLRTKHAPYTPFKESPYMSLLTTTRLRVQAWDPCIRHRLFMYTSQTYTHTHRHTIHCLLKYPLRGAHKSKQATADLCECAWFGLAEWHQAHIWVVVDVVGSVAIVVGAALIPFQRYCCRCGARPVGTRLYDSTAVAAAAAAATTEQLQPRTQTL